MAATMSLESALHRDMRSEHHAFKRDKDSSTKWAKGHRGIEIAAALRRGGGEDEQLPYKPRPQKRGSEIAHQIPRYKFTNTKRSHGDSLINNRISRKNDAMRESSIPTTDLTRSMIDMLPNPDTKTVIHSKIISISPSVYEDRIVEGVLYSFDKKESPLQSLGLCGLVDEAEKQFIVGETERIVREEWETLDESGEVERISAGKGRKGRKIRVKTGGRKQGGVAAETQVDEDGWELLSEGEEK